MRPDSFRFRPPPHELSAELAWTLARAFGPPPVRPSAVERPELALRWAAALALRERIAGRLPTLTAERELGVEAAESLRRSRERLAARGLLLRELLTRVCAVAVEIGTGVVALKGIALLESGACAWGSRPLVDLDLLVAAERAGDLQAALEAAGYERSGEAERHHLTPLADPRLGELELHRHIPGLAVAGSRPATAGDLRRAGLTRPADGIDGLELPAPELLAAHALTHTLDQHAFNPAAYPVTRLAGDLIDLAVATGVPVGRLTVEARERLGGSVSARELGAAESLCRALAAGDPQAAGADGLALLRHAAAAISSPRYRRQLRRRAALRALGRRQWSKFRSELSRRVRPRRGLD